jgi:hypothetical protein
MASGGFGRRLVESAWFTVELHVPTVKHRRSEEAKKRRRRQETACRVAPVRLAGRWPAARTLTCSFGSSNLRIFDVYRRSVKLFA